MSPSDLKHLTPKNWLDPDPASLLPTVFRLPGVEIPTPPWPERLNAILSPRLSTVVPSDIASLFEVAQGAMAYGYFYYPLYTLGEQHLFRALEAAVILRARRAGLTKKRIGFGEVVVWLTKQGVLTQQAADALKPLLVLRNEASHPRFQSLITPGMAIRMLDDVGQEINSILDVADG